MITEEHVNMYIVCARGNHESGFDVNRMSNCLTARQSSPVKKFFE